ncbi:hypothetical protein HSBAA_45190 [Vreelandella sulfidaeris]|uniref:NAD(P)-binding domain-containing protein n=1 Tax=Vreelandella sulfidaeris TaxID=115553 RepID=A0A455UD37_9GAMM|nr:hypothetical protein HSBAA_45190 [Halomonas sulfidaeris]
MRPYMAAKFAADAHLRNSGVPYVILKPGRLTDEAASQQFASSIDEAGDNQISRANVAHALLHVVQSPMWLIRNTYCWMVNARLKSLLVKLVL